MAVRVVVAGLLVGVLGVLTRFAADWGENLIFKQVAQFLREHPEALPLPANTATFWSAVVTLWIGLLFAVLYHLAGLADSIKRGLLLGLLCWAGFVVPMQILQLLWTRTSLYALGATTVGFLLQLVLGGLLLARLLRPTVAKLGT